MTLSLGLNDCDHADDWAFLTEEEIKEVLHFYPFKNRYQKTIFKSHRPYSSASEVMLEGGETLFIKKHSLFLRSQKALKEEHDFLSFLHKENIAVSRPYLTKDGEDVLSLNGACYELFPSLKGEDPYQNITSWSPYFSLEHAAESGKELAKFHRKAALYEADERGVSLLLSSLTPFLSENFALPLKNYILQMKPNGEALFSWLEKEKYWEEMNFYIGLFHKRLLPFMFHVKLSWGHGDWGGTNLSWNGDKITQIFDFGMSNLMARSFDVAIAIERSFVNWLNPLKKPAWHKEQLQAFLFSYQQEYPLTKGEKYLVSLFLPLAHILYALSEVIYYRHLLQKEKEASIAYHSYVIGHLKWFLSDDGKALLDFLNEWAETSC